MILISSVLSAIPVTVFYGHFAQYCEKRSHKFVGIVYPNAGLFCTFVRE